MKYALPLALVAGPALAHSGDAPHVHPHDGASWLIVVALLGVVAVGAPLALARLRSRK
ncbi:hypothetical protein [Salipiger bermudensis]|uniref:hypothetical protein n=1 Tax=Salipiger bermudensis TaxID=344736 RepID=UPI001CD3A385|nr:hypothetical protein [Salipiger bermudensis]MCA1285099.1 hypothetical protein [Salipiger bermudensis]